MLTPNRVQLRQSPRDHSETLAAMRKQTECRHSCDIEINNRERLRERHGDLSVCTHQLKLARQ